MVGWLVVVVVAAAGGGGGVCAGNACTVCHLIDGEEDVDG